MLFEKNKRGEKQKFCFELEIKSEQKKKQNQIVHSTALQKQKLKIKEIEHLMVIKGLMSYEVRKKKFTKSLF